MRSAPSRSTTPRASPSRSSPVSTSSCASRPGTLIPAVDPGELEAKLADAIRSWADDFSDALVVQAGEEDAARLQRSYPDPFPEAYKEDFPARTGVADLRRIDALDPSGGLAMSLYTPYDAAPGERRFKIFRNGPISLSEVLPTLQRMGVEVVDERPYQITAADGRLSWVYDFGLRYDPSGEVGPDSVKELFQAAFEAVWSGAAESDGFNALVLRAGLSWRQAMVLRAYAKYLRQAGSTFSQEYIEQALLSNVPIARLLVRLFEARLHPAYATARDDVMDGMLEELNGALEGVASLDQDRILRSFLTLIQATLRHQLLPGRRRRQAQAYVSFKLDPQRIPELPQPRPKFEIWVYSLASRACTCASARSPAAACAGPDRREDFRTEVLGLVKAQSVKNAVIVPVGPKGGFVVNGRRRRRATRQGDRDAFFAEGVACYKTFICGLLDITDNLVQGAHRAAARGRPPRRRRPLPRRRGRQGHRDVLRHRQRRRQGATASGSVTRSPRAGRPATTTRRWGSRRAALGVGPRHFREMGLDTQADDFTVVGSAT
jgi:glutamate dehydrogenase